MVGFLDRLWNRAPEPSPEVSRSQEVLRQLATERPSVAVHAALVADLLPFCCRGEEVPDLPYSEEEWNSKLSQGSPLLRGLRLPFPAEQVQRSWSEICNTLSRHGRKHDVSPLVAISKERPKFLEELIEALLAGDAVSLAHTAESLGLDAALTATVLRFTLLPFLTTLAASLAALRQRTDWDRGHCPTCGSWPLLGELRGLEQRRFLRCGWCATEWEFPRLRCLFCGTRDVAVLGYLHVEGEEDRLRAARCDSCRGYVKTMATLQGLSLPELLVADLATLHLDLAAAERGYGVFLSHTSWRDELHDAGRER